jgi:hypothetical protein
MHGVLGQISVVALIEQLVPTEFVAIAEEEFTGEYEQLVD